MLKETIKYYVFEALRPFALSVVTGLCVWLAVSTKSDVFIVFALVTFIPLFALFMLRLSRVLRALWYQSKCYERMASDQQLKGILIEEGGNRTGKSLSGHATLYNKALGIELYISRFTKLYRAKKTHEKLPQKEHLEYEEISGTYKQMQVNPDLIVPLVTNNKVKGKDGRKSSELTGGHLLQLDKLPQPCALGFDETRAKLIGDLFKDKDGAYILSLLAKLFNHFTGDSSLWVMMEQNTERTFHFYRDSLCMVRHQLGVVVYLEPVRLLKKQEKLFTKLDKMEYPSYGFAIKVLNLIKRIRRIGVLQLNYRLMGNKESAAGTQLKDGIVQDYLPCDLPFAYDNRFFRTGYACKDKDITLSRFRGNLQSEERVTDLIRLAEDNTMRYKGKKVTDLYDEVKEKKQPAVPP